MNFIGKIDFDEESFEKQYPGVVDILLTDRTSNKNLKWNTKSYEYLGSGFNETDFIELINITGKHAGIIKPRIKKTIEDKRNRVKDSAEIFTPTWLCNLQNNVIDDEWFGYSDVFNKRKGNEWIPTKKIVFKNGLKWEDYVKSKRLEITCGEAPYIVSRYDTTSGEIFSVDKRVGLLDRKLRVVTEFCNNKIKWLKYAKMAFQSVYGFEFQGDNILLARENLLLTFLEYYYSAFSEFPSLNEIKQIAIIISWNIFQMDGLKMVIPNSCKTYISNTVDLFGEHEETIKCYGCENNNLTKHNGLYCLIMDWDINKPTKYYKLLKGSNYGY